MPCEHCYYTVMYDFLSQPDKSWGIGHVLFAITKSCRISQSACRSLRLMAFQVKQEQGYTLSIHKILWISSFIVIKMPRSAKEKPEINFSVLETIELLNCTKNRMSSGIKVPHLKLRKGMGSPVSFDLENCTNNYNTQLNCNISFLHISQA